MATLTPSQRPPSTPGASATSWSRSGEPGSAFSGLSRGGRGRGSGRGRSGRSGRGGPRETKVTGVDFSSDKPNITSPSKAAPSPSMMPVTPSPLPHPPLPAATEKTTAVSNAPSSARSRKNPRRVSRSIPVVVVPPVSTSTPSNPGSSKPSGRKRRSQTGKAAPRVKVPSHDDNTLPPHRPRTESIPYPAPIKETPPHLTNNSFNKHTDVNAALERVHTNNVDHQANTPGSHIDWAGDDDDSLPDLDDWGITPTKVETNENGLISPLAVSGLRPLPDILIDVETTSPHQKSPESTNGAISEQTAIMPYQVKSPNDGISTSDDAHVAAPIITTQEPLVSAPASAKVSLCPTLPPDAADVINQDVVPPKQVEVFAPVPEVDRGLAASIHSLNASADKEDPFSNLHALSGLAASIHAPPLTDMAETKSAPSNTSCYSRASPEHWTHNRSHITGRPPLYSRANNNGRPSRSGYNTPRGGLSAGGNYQPRTHSTPPTTSHTHRSPAHRPILTGDAISRIAKTIGNTAPSSARVPAISAAQE